MDELLQVERATDARRRKHDQPEADHDVAYAGAHAAPVGTLREVRHIDGQEGHGA